MKKLAIILISLILAMPFGGIGAAMATRTFVITEGSALVTVDGDSYQVYFPPISTNNKTFELVAAENKLMISTLDFMKMIGGSLDFNPKSRILTFTTCDKTIGLEYNKSQVIVDGKVISVPIGMIIENGRTLVSPKVLCDVLGFPAKYDDNAKSLTMELPLCPIKLTTDTLVNTYAKVNIFDEQSKRLTVTDCTGSLYDIDMQDSHMSFAKGDMLHLYIRQMDNGLFKPLVSEKIDQLFGSGHLQATMGSQEYVLNGKLQNGRDKFMLIDGVPFIPFDTAFSVLGMSLMPGDLSVGQLSIYSMRMKATFWLESAKLVIDMQNSTKPQTLEMEKPMKLVNGIAYLPASVLTQILGGKANFSEDGGKLDVVLEKMYFGNTVNSVFASLESIDCDNAVGTIITDSGKVLPITLLPQPTKVPAGSQKCQDLVVGNTYNLHMDSIVLNDGSVKHFVSAWFQSENNFNKPASERIVTGTVTEILSQMQLRLKLDGVDGEPISIMGATSQLKAGWKVKVLLLKLNKNDACMMDYAVLDDQSKHTLQAYSMVLGNNSDSWTGTDDKGTSYELAFRDVPWKMTSFLEPNARYIVKGFEKLPGKITVVDFLKSSLPLISKTTLNTVYDKTSKTSMMQAFRFNGKTYVNYRNVSKSYVTTTLPEIVIADNQLNLAIIRIGTKTANLNGKQIELENYPISFGFGNYTYIEISDAAKISEATFEETADGMLVVSKPDSRLAVTSDFYFSARIDEIDKEGYNATATDEFGRTAKLLFVDMSDLDYLEVGTSYQFSTKNMDWHNYIVFRTLAKTDFVDSKPHKLVFGTIDSIDCQNQSFTIKDSDGSLTKCVFGTIDNDCSLLKAGQSVAVDGHATDDAIRIVKKWHFKTLPEIIPKKFVLAPDEWVKDGSSKEITKQGKVKVIDGQYYIDLVSAQIIYGGTRNYVYPSSKRHDFALWGNLITFWSDRDKYIVNGKLEDLPGKIQFVDGVMLIPATMLLPFEGGTAKMAEDGSSMTIEVRRCPVPVWHKLQVLNAKPLKVARIDGTEAYLEVGGMEFRSVVGDLRKLEGLAVGECVSINYAYHFIDQNNYLFFIDKIEKTECK